MNADNDKAILIQAAMDAAADTTVTAGEARAAATAGATLLGIAPPRDEETGLPDVARTSELLAALRADDAEDTLSPVVQVVAETERLGPDPVQAFARAVRPEAVRIAFRTVMPDEGDAALKRARGFFRWLKVMEIAPQFVMRRPAEVARFVRLRGMDYIPFRRPFLLFELGAEDPGADSTVDELDGFLAALDGQPAEWAACTHGRDEAAVIFRTVLEGGHVCTGPACNRTLPDGRVAENAAGLVTAAADILRQAGRRIMTPEEARALLRETVK